MSKSANRSMKLVARVAPELKNDVREAVNNPENEHDEEAQVIRAAVIQYLNGGHHRREIENAVDNASITVETPEIERLNDTLEQINTNLIQISGEQSQLSQRQDMALNLLRELHE